MRKFLVIFIALLLFTASCGRSNESADQLYNKGLNYLGEGNFTASFELFNKIDTLYPESPYGYYGRAIALEKDSCEFDAINEYIRLLTLNKEFLPGIRALAILASKTDRPVLAMELAGEYRRLSDDSLESARIMTETLLEAGEFKMARKELEKILPNHPTNSELLLLEAWLDLHDGEYARGLERCSKALAGSPGQTDILIEVGDFYSTLGRFDSAAVYYREALKSSPNDYYVKANIAQAMLNLGYINAAAMLIKQLEHDPPDNHMSIFLKTKLMEAEGRTNEAVAYYYRKVASYRESPATLLQRARLRKRVGDTHNANMALENAMVSSENEAFHVSLTDEITLESARLFLDDGDWRSTKGILIRSQDILPLDFNTIYITAIVQLLGGEADAAEASLARLEMLTGNNPIRLARMGNLFERVDSLRLADSLYDRALAEDKFSPTAIVGKSNIMKKKGNPKAAIKYLESKEDYIIDNRMVWPRLISLYQETGDIGKARDLMGKLIDIAPENIDRYRKAIELAEAGGSQEEVDEIYERCLKANPDNEYANVFAANYFMTSGREAKAGDLLEKAYSAGVLPDEDLYLLGLISEKEGKLDSAMTLYRKSVEINPMYGNSYGRMAALMLRRDSLDDRALMDFTNFITLAQRSELKPEYNFLTGRAQLIQKRYRAAARSFNIALKADASNPEYNFYAGINYIRLDSLAKARTHLNKALKNGLAGKLKAEAEKALGEI